jgi:osmotically-inducible protein OsmY
MKTDLGVALDCADRLYLVLDIDDRDIAIKVIDGIVLLVGIVRTDLERARAEQTVKKVRGVMGLTNNLSVCPRNASVPPDPDITRGAVAALRQQFPTQAEHLQVTVQHGRVSLEGELDWYYQRDVIEAVVRALPGVTLVTNRIRVSQPSLAGDGLTGVYGA